MARAPAENAIRESWFWSEILRDHATFIQDTLGPKEDQQVRWAEGFKLSFERAAVESRRLAQVAGIAAPAGAYAVTGVPAESPISGLQGAELTRYDQEATRLSRTLLEAIGSLRAFKDQLLQKKLDSTVALGLSPSLLQHMIIEAEEAHRVLARVRETAPLPPVLEALHHHLVWLPDAAGHAAVICSGLDGLEQELRTESRAFHEVFSGMQMKALELYSMVKAAPRPVGALKRLNQDSLTKMAAFRTFLAELRDRLAGGEVLTGYLPPLLADHMLREELYYMEKVALLAPAEQVNR